jgi:hypothetical protein
MSTLDGTFNYYTPNTLDGLDNVSGYLTDSLLINGTNAMAADLDMGGHAIKNLGNGTAPDEAVNLGQLNAGLVLKADLSYVNTQLALKSDLSYVNTQLALKSDLSYVNTQLALKSDLSYVNTQLALKSDLSYVNTQLALKANDADVVKLTGAQSIDGLKTFTTNPVFPNPYVTTDTFQLISANKTFSSGYLRVYDTVTLRDIAFQTNASAGAINPAVIAGDNVVYGSHLAMFGSDPCLNLCVASGTSNGIRIKTAGITLYSNVNFNNKSLTGLPAPVNSSDAVRLTDLNTKANDVDVVKKTLNQTIDGIKTFTSSPIVPQATSTGQAVRYDELILKANNADVVKLTGAQSVDGVKTFTSSPIVPQATSSGQAVRYNELILKADDSSVVKLTGAQTVAGVKTFSDSPIIPAASATGQAARYDELQLKADLSYVTAGLSGKADVSYVDNADAVLQADINTRALDSAVVKLTGAQTIAGVKTFSSNPVFPNPYVTTDTFQLISANKTFSSGYVRVYEAGTGRDVAIQANSAAGSINPSTIVGDNLVYASAGVGVSPVLNLCVSSATGNGIRIQSTGINVYNQFLMNSNRISNVGAPSANNDAATKKYVDDNAVFLTGNQSVAGVKTFSSSPIVPAATATGQAARYDELILKADTSTVNSALALKANDADVVKLTGNQTVAGIKSFSSSPIIPQALSSGQAVRYNELILKADTSTVNTQLALKADDADVVKLTGGQNISGIKSFQDMLQINQSSQFLYMNAYLSAGTAFGNSRTATGDTVIMANKASNPILHLGTVDALGGGAGVRIAGSTITAYSNMSMNGNRIQNLGVPSTANDATTKTYVDNANALKLNLSGGTMTGLLTLSGAPVAGNNATTKTYVDNADALKLNLTGGTISGALTVSGTTTLNGTLARGASSWSFGEVVKIQFPVITTVNVSLAAGSPMTTVFEFDFQPTLSTSILGFQIDCPYYMNGGGEDTWFSQVIDVTGGNIVIPGSERAQDYNNSSGGGTRSMALFPMAFTYAPGSTAGRHYEVQVSCSATAGEWIYFNALPVGSSKTTKYVRVEEIR